MPSKKCARDTEGSAQTYILIDYDRLRREKRTVTNFLLLTEHLYFGPKVLKLSPSARQLLGAIARFSRGLHGICAESRTTLLVKAQLPISGSSHQNSKFARLVNELVAAPFALRLAGHRLSKDKRRCLIQLLYDEDDARNAELNNPQVQKAREWLKRHRKKQGDAWRARATHPNLSDAYPARATHMRGARAPRINLPGSIDELSSVSSSSNAPPNKPTAAAPAAAADPAREQMEELLNEWHITGRKRQEILDLPEVTPEGLKAAKGTVRASASTSVLVSVLLNEAQRLSRKLAARKRMQPAAAAAPVYSREVDPVSDEERKAGVALLRAAALKAKG